VKAFFEEVSAQYIGVHFTTISLVDMLTDNAIKSFLQAAENSLNQGEYESCLIECRKAIFMQFEKHYDAGMYPRKGGLNLLTIASGRGDKVPSYARIAEYIANYVTNPTDLIVIDHDRLERDLLAFGVDRQVFWNVWRLTPAVYRGAGKDSPWIIKRELALVHGDSLKANAEYVFPSTVDMMIAVHKSMAKVKLREHHRFHVDLANERAPVCEKADKNSIIVGHLPGGVIRVDTDFSVSGQDGDEYWFVRTFDGDERILEGYLHQSDVAIE
jgi:hypothetical protein